MRVLRRLRPERVRVLCVRMYGSLRSNGGPQLSAAKARCSRSLVACASQAAARGKAAPSPDCTQCGILRPHPARPPQASSRTGSRGSACRSPPPHAAERQVSPAGSTGLLPPSANRLVRRRRRRQPAAAPWRRAAIRRRARASPSARLRAEPESRVARSHLPQHSSPKVYCWILTSCSR